MTIDLKAIRAAAEAATKGEWVWQEGTPVISKHWNGHDRAIACVDWTGRESGANAKHIATANPSTVIALLDRLEAAEKDAARYRWIRAEHERYDPVCHLSWKQHLNRDCSYWVNTTSLDKDIDAAMKDEQK